MPRTPRKQAIVIPTNSLVASAVRYSGKSARIYQPNQDWQRECYRHYVICGEVRFAAKFYGQAMSRATLMVVKKSNKGPVAVSGGQPVDVLAELFSGADGQAQMLDALGTHLTVAGECYLVGRGTSEGDVWEIVSILEMRVQGTKWSIIYGDGLPPVELKDSDVVIRIWNPHPAKRIEADSPLRSMLPILTEIEWLTRHIFAQVSSRLAGAGLLLLPQSMTFPPPPEVDGKPAVTANEADAFMLTLADAMLTPIEDPSSPSATIPVVGTVPDESVDKVKLLHFWSNLDEKALDMRAAAISRFADGMDLPREQVLGMSSNEGTGGGTSNGVSHWGAWQIEESTIKFHIEPMLELICNALTIGYLRPQVTDPAFAVAYDTSALRLRPDRSKEAFELYDRGGIKLEVLLAENGFDTDDMMDADEFKLWLLKKVATGSATPEMVNAALELLGVDLGVEPEPTAMPNESRPPPSLDEHPDKPRTPDEGDFPALVAASDALVFRALERAGNRIMRRENIQPGIPAYEVHTLFAANGSAAEDLANAWTCAPQVLAGLTPDVDRTVHTLDSYCRALMAEQSPHTRVRLQTWLEAAR